MHTTTLKSWYFLLAISISLFSTAQTPVNGYARITAVAGTTLTVTSVNETYDTFEDGEYVIVMQMQDDVIGGNTGNSASFGTLAAISSAGLYEVARISSHTESSGLPVSVTLTSALVNTYHTGANSALQLISYPVFGSPNYTISSAVNAVPWNGTTGGVVAMWITGTLTLNSSISVSAQGFRGGTKNTPNGYTTCDPLTYTTALATRYAGKGEGIYKSTSTTYQAARGRIINGGGGGNDVNAGGGGGGNYFAGGDGGIGWIPAGTGCVPTVGGLGGAPLVGYISVGRVFMGGGGGGGHENDNVGTVGANGGGVILLRANSIATSGTCTNRSISADGGTATDAVNDGSGGGGAGGSIVLQVNSYSITVSCPMVISSSGGNGGSSVTTGTHGGGGGGGQGVVIFSSAQPSSNVTTTTNSGTGGTSCTGCPASNNATNGGGPNNSGIITGSSGPLPIELLRFTGALNGNEVDLDWSTATETNNDYFIIERAGADGVASEIGMVDGAGNSHALIEYAFVDKTPLPGANYYRLRQVDFNGTFSYSNWVFVNFEPDDHYVRLYPNPAATGEVQAELINYRGKTVLVRVTDAFGRIISEETTAPQEWSSVLRLDLSQQASGFYNVQVVCGNDVRNMKLLVK